MAIQLPVAPCNRGPEKDYCAARITFKRWFLPWQRLSCGSCASPRPSSRSAKIKLHDRSDNKPRGHIMPNATPKTVKIYVFTTINAHLLRGGLLCLGSHCNFFVRDEVKDADYSRPLPGVERADRDVYKLFVMLQDCARGYTLREKLSNPGEKPLRFEAAFKRTHDSSRSEAGNM